MFTYRFDGKILLHVIEGEGLENGVDVAEERESKLFPDPTSRNDVISCHALTPDFLVNHLNFRAKICLLIFSQILTFALGYFRA